MARAIQAFEIPGAVAGFLAHRKWKRKGAERGGDRAPRPALGGRRRIEGLMDGFVNVVVRVKSRLGVLAALAIVTVSCAGSPPAEVGECVSDDAANVVLGQFPDIVDCPSDRSLEEKLADPIYRIVAVGKTTSEVEADPACENNLAFSVWYDEDWAICGELLT